MTNFNSLPLEVKRMIVRQVHYADFEYRQRIGKASSSPREQLKGQALSYLALANKEMRMLCLRWLIWNVKSSKTKDPMFEYHILPSPHLASYVTSVEFEKTVDLERITFIVLYVLPRLPNLRRIMVRNQSFFSSFGHLQELAFDEDWSREKFVWRKLLEIAAGASKLTLHFSDIDQITPIIAGNAVNLDYLDLRPAYGCPSLSFQNSPILPLLDHCSSLRQLKLRISPQPSTPSPDPLFHQTALSHSYTFQTTLTILDIYSAQKYTTTFDSSVLHFASLFPQLRDLHLCGQGFRIHESENVQTFAFPSLLRIDLQLHDVESTTRVLRRMDTPRLRLLLIHLGDSTELAERINLEPAIILTLALQIKRFGTTLQTVKIRSKSGIYWTSLGTFVALLSPHSYDIFTSWDRGEAESLVEHVGTGDESELPSREIVLKGLVQGSKELIEWAKERIEETEQTKDLSGAGLMYKALKNVKELRKWFKE